MTKKEFVELFQKNKDRYMQEWKQLLSFPSISANPDYHTDCTQCAEWLVDHLRDMGMHSRLLETAGKPAVFGQHDGEPDAPTVLYYGHYDVQPVDPLDKWETPPFEPTLKNGRMYARGASDNKGQVLYSLKAIETLLHKNALRCTVKVILEGEEEAAGRGMTDCLEAWKDLLRADVLLVTDTSMAAPNVPAVMMGLRGVFHLTAELTGPDHDLHSGSHGGRAPNPAEGIAELIASLHDEDGRIAVREMYDGVQPPNEEERRLLALAPFDEEEYRHRTGVAPISGEPEFTPVERVGFRPSLSVNGVHSGYDGPGMKTIIPSVARVKISGRVVAGQDPRACLDAVIGHLQTHTPNGFHLEIKENDVGGPALRLDPHSEITRLAKRILDDIAPHEALFIWEGASVPVVASLAAAAGAQPLLVGFALDDDNAHAPNESFSIDQLLMGYQYIGLILLGIGGK